MNKFLPIQFKFNIHGFLQLSLISLALFLSLGSHTRANAQSHSEVEVISVPPQEAYFIEDETQATSSSDRCSLQDRNTLGDSNTPTPQPNDVEHMQTPTQTPQPNDVENMQTPTNTEDSVHSCT